MRADGNRGVSASRNGSDADGAGADGAGAASAGANGAGPNGAGAAGANECGEIRAGDSGSADLEPLEPALRAVESQFALVLQDAAAVREACDALSRALEQRPDLTAPCLERLVPLLARRQGTGALALSDFLEERIAAADPSARETGTALSEMLAARDTAIRRRALLLAFRIGRCGRGSDLVPAVASLIESEPEIRDDAEILERCARFLSSLAGDELAGDKTDTGPLEHLLVAGSPLVRMLAARILDRNGEPVPRARLERILGGDAAVLAPHLEYTRTTHRDLIDLTPEGCVFPGLAESLRQAEAIAGRTLLGAVIAELGWARVAWGLSCGRWIGLSIDGGYPLAVAPEEAARIEASVPARRVWDRFLFIAHGGSATGRADPAEDAAVHRFRSYNVLHAELLAEILEVAPLVPEKVGRILARMDQVVEHFAALFTGRTEDAVRVGGIYSALKARVLALVGGLPAGTVVSPEATRLVQMFEDPRNLDEVRTLHGLKRYLHQQGLRHAFGAFGSARSTNRTVDLVVASPARPLHVLRKIRYLDFEPEGEGIPFAVGLAVEAYARRLVQGRPDVPEIEFLLYGNEVQIFVRFRNHPVFIRLDLSPPLRGGMIDLEYFGVSQYELDQHPEPTLPWIRRMFRRLEFDVQADGTRLHVRYDKERALDFGELIEKARSLFTLVPHLMEIDWVIGALQVPEPVKAVIADAWTDRVATWGTLPIPEFLTSDRGRILCGIESGPAGERELAWNGTGPYQDRFGDGTNARILQPLRDAAQGAAEEAHDSERLARLLLEGGRRLDDAARTAAAVVSIERHLRFRTTGSVQGYAVERAPLVLRGECAEIAVLRDGDGVARVALAGERPFHLWPWVAALAAPAPLTPDELVRRLRRDNYLTGGYDGADHAAGPALKALFAFPNPLEAPGPQPGEHMVAGTVASAGRAAGFARFCVENRPAEDFDGAVLFAPALTPEDTPLIRRSAAVVSTGGGVLSHAGLIALELGKPALIIPGRWEREPDGRSHLRYRTLDYREESSTVGPYSVVRRCDLAERDEILREGDLVVVDAEAGVLGVLGQDRDALAVQQELRRLQEAAAELEDVRPAANILSLRGRLLRAVHQLEKLLARIDRPALARHATRELLLSRKGPGGVEGLLRSLFRNPSCGEHARQTAAHLQTELRRRRDSKHREALRLLPSAETLFEVLRLRLEVREADRTLAEVDSVLRAVRSLGSPDAAAPATRHPSAGLDRACVRRLQELRASKLEMLRATSGNPDVWWRASHLLHAIESIDELLRDPGPDGARGEARGPLRIELETSRAAALCALSSRRILTCADGGLELAPLVGGKAANLGEIARVLGPGRVPAWFAVTNAAVSDLLLTPAGRASAAPGLEPGATLGAAVDAVLAREASSARKAAAVRSLWLEADCSAELERDIAAAYAALASSGSPEPFVAIRSSGLEEDSETSSWAGQFDTFLFVRGFEAVMEHLRLALAGWWTERAIEQRLAVAAGRGDMSGYGPGAGHARNGANGRSPAPGALSVRGGVLIQRMVDARAAGVLHTLSPTGSGLREMVVNAGLGLGEGVVSGTVEVDHIVVSRETDPANEPLRFRYLVGDKRSRVVFDRKSGRGTRREETLYHQRLRPALEYTDLLELVRAASRLEEAYGTPLDVEFAFEEDSLSILQARPVVAFQTALHRTLELDPLGGRSQEEPS